MSTALAVLNNAMSSTGDYYPVTQACINWPSVWPSTYCYHSTVTRDNGEKAFKIAQALIEKKLIKSTSANQFIELMNAILEELKRA